MNLYTLVMRTFLFATGIGLVVYETLDRRPVNVLVMATAVVFVIAAIGMGDDPPVDPDRPAE